MADTSVSVVGLARLRKDLRQVGEGLADLKEANARAGSIVVGAAGPRAPRKSGALAGSGRASRTVSRVSILWGGARIPYAGPIHWGWAARGIEANPFIVDAAQATEGAWTAAYQHDLDRLASSLDGRTY